MHMQGSSQEIHIAFATDDNYAPYCSVAIQSIKETTSSQCEIYIMTDGLSSENESKLVGMSDGLVQVQMVDVSAKMKEAGTFGLHYLSKSTYYRLYLAELLPDRERILYLDCDVIVRRDLNDLYSTELNDCYVAACQDLGFRLPNWSGKTAGVQTLANEGVDYGHYFNAGIILMNLAAMREDNLQALLVNLAQRQDLMCQDQCVFNIACKGRWVELPMEWNYSLHVHSPENLPRLPGDPTEAAIAHFTSLKPWDWYYSDYALQWFEYAAHSPFRTEIKLRVMSGKRRLSLGERLCRPLYTLLAHMPFLPTSLVARAAGKSESVNHKIHLAPCIQILKGN